MENRVPEILNHTGPTNLIYRHQTVTLGFTDPIAKVSLLMPKVLPNPIFKCVLKASS